MKFSFNRTISFIIIHHVIIYLNKNVYIVLWFFVINNAITNAFPTVNLLLELELMELRGLILGAF